MQKYTTIHPATVHATASDLVALRVAWNRANFFVHLSRQTRNPDAQRRLERLWAKQLEIVQGLVARLRLN